MVPEAERQDGKAMGKKWNLMKRWIGCGKVLSSLAVTFAETDDGQRGLNNRIVKLEQALNGKASAAA